MESANYTTKPKITRKKKIIIIISSILALLIIGGILAYLFTLGVPGKNLRADAKFSYWEEKGYNKGKVLLCGSSFIEYWETSDSDLKPLETYNVGVAATVISDWDRWIEKLIIPFAPNTILLYVGSNDIHGGLGSKKGDVAGDEAIALLKKIHDKLPNTFIHYISIAPTIAREKVWNESNTCNTVVKNFCGSTSFANFIDCTSALLNDDGSLKKEIYVKDNLHFNEKGYEIWRTEIRKALGIYEQDT
ncbi:MAG: GDSL-type esterase/lipase family protein [Christensenellaceae bacterium]|jgi:lysophospholipase L1-like esterase|nr:GDSL-type esterase/lipase family protein [Christensenellaceae bacterium]